MGRCQSHIERTNEFMKFRYFKFDFYDAENALIELNLLKIMIWI